MKVLACGTLDSMLDVQFSMFDVRFAAGAAPLKPGSVCAKFLRFA
jgi:hypothetical protein